MNVDWVQYATDKYNHEFEIVDTQIQELRQDIGSNLGNHKRDTK